MELYDLSNEFKKWKDKNSFFTPFHYIGAICNFENLLAISKLLFPDVVLIADCFLLKDTRQWKSFNEFWENAKTSADLEKTINFICINSLTNIDSEKNDNVLNKEIAYLIKNSWELFFSNEYKDLDLSINVYEDNNDGWCITVFQNKNENRQKPPVWNIN
ncbi:hypothetical protein FACS1894151_10450 [Spirochaetia bacterium]|nr:hypothetical protein FACS1894151_10450 [Spirochaetia bacterium]